MPDLGQEMHDLCRELFPLGRSLTGDGFRQSLGILQRDLPELRSLEIPSGTTCFDWVVPPEWNIRDGYILSPDGTKFCDFHLSNLHVVGYSIPVNREIPLDELQAHLYSLPDQPDAIPYVTSYYQRRWGFCLPHREREQLLPGNYRVVIDSDLKDGSLTYGEWILPGQSPQEILLSTYLCHPSLANNELSGPVVTTFLARWLQSLPHRKFTYRVLFIPETIGSIAYLSQHYQYLQQVVVAGFVVTCVGDDRAYSYLPSRQGNTLADQVARHVLRLTQPDFVSYRYLDRGSDERQYCSPGIDLPVCSIMRTKYGCYPEYHTSLDDLTLVTPQGLWGGYQALQRALQCLELNETLATTVLCEPQLGKRGLYPTTSTKTSGAQIRDMMNFLAYCDGRTSSLEIADLIGVPLWELQTTIEKLKQEGILVSVTPA